MFASFNKLWFLFNKKNKFSFIVLIFLILIGTFFEMLSISLLIPLVSLILDSNSFLFEILSKIGLEHLIVYLNFKNFLIFFVTIYAIKTSYLIYLSHYQINFIINFFTKLLNRVFKNYLIADYIFHLNNDSAKLVRNLNSEVHASTIGFTTAILNIILDIIILLGLFIILIVFQPNFIVFLVTILFILILTLLTVLRKKIRNIGKERQNFSFHNLKIIIEALGGIKEIKVSETEKQVSKNFFDNSILLKKTNYLYAIFNSLPKLFIEFVVVFVISIILFLFTKFNYDSVKIITYLTILLGVLLRAYPSFTKLSVSIINYNLNKAAFDLIYKEINETKGDLNLDKNNNITKKLSFNKSITFKNISFSYPNRKKEVLSNLNLVFKKNEKIGIIGETGSGKSTFVNILTGLLKPISGEILVDGNNINFNMSEWRTKIGYVPQKVFLNSDTLKNNIAFNIDKEKILDSKILDCIRDAQLEDFVNTLEKMENTKVGEDGKQLSGGQRQRIGIARSLYKNPEILVFDEATSALDEKTENNFLNAVNSLSKNKTIFMISHKKSILDICDAIYLVENSSLRKI